MNFFEQQMRQMFGDTDIIREPKFIGKTMIGKLDDELLVKLQFISTFNSTEYNAVQASVINRTEGVVDNQTFEFSDLIGIQIFDSGEKVEPHHVGAWRKFGLVYSRYRRSKGTDRLRGAGLCRDVSGGRNGDDAAMTKIRANTAGDGRPPSLYRFQTGGESICLTG